MSATLFDGVVLTVEIGFSTSSGSGTVPINSTLASINWTDVSSYVRSVSTSRGRSSELDSFQTGSASIVFSNADRRFDPEYASGPYYGSLTPLRPIRIRAQYGVDPTTNLFFGWIEQWPQSYENPTDATVTVTASDAFKILNLLTLPSYWEYRIGLDAPTQWFKFDDGTAPETAFDSVSKINGGEWSTTGASGASLIQDNSGSSAVFDGSNWINLLESQPYPQGDNYVTIEFWIQTSTTTQGDYAIMGGTRSWGIGMTVDASGVGVIRGFWGDPVLGIYPTMVTTTRKVNDGKPHHVVMVWDANAGTRSIYVDSINFATETFPTYLSTFPFGVDGCKIAYPFSPFTTAADNFTSYFDGTIDDLCIYDGTALTAAQVLIHYQIGKGTYANGQRTSERIASVLSMAGWMSDASDLATGSGFVGAIVTENKTPLSIAQDCEAAEQGKLFIDRDGELKFISRNALASTAIYNTSQYTFGDGSGEFGYSSLSFEYNDRLIYNRTVVGRANGATVTVNDTTSQGQYFVRTDSLSSLIVNSDQQVVDIANARSVNYGQPRLRVEQLTFTPRQSPSLPYYVAIGVEIGTRLTVKRRPQGVGSVISKEVIVEGISHSISPDGWETSFTLSPVYSATFILDSAIFGVLDSNVLGY
jgi:hypothetical protein